MRTNWLLCEAIAGTLEASAFSHPVTVQAAWSVPYEPAELSGIRVTVAPDRSQQEEYLDRAKRIQELQRVSILIQMKVSDRESATISPAAVVQQEIDDLLRRSANLVRESVTFRMRPGTVSGLVRRHLEEYLVYTGFLDVTYVSMRN